MTNDTFAARVGCHYSYASRLKNGERLPSVAMLYRIIEAFGLNEHDALIAYRNGSGSFSSFLRTHVFSKPDVVELR